MLNPLKVSLDNIIPLTEARDHFSQIVNEVQKDKLYVLTKGGKPAVAIIDVKYLEALTGGEVRKATINEEIKKDPAKVGLPPMIEHQPSKPVVSPAPPTNSVPMPSPAPTPVKAQNEPIQAKPIAPPPAPPISVEPTPVTPTEPKPISMPSPNSNSNLNSPPLKTPVEDKGSKVDIQVANYPGDNSGQNQKPQLSPDDKVGPAQYAGASDDDEVDDMGID